MPRYVLTDEQVVDLLKAYADRLRECSGETREADCSLRTVEWLTRVTNEKLFVYLHMRDLYTADELREVIAKALEEGPGSPGGTEPEERG